MVDLDKYYRMDKLTYGEEMWREGYERGYERGMRKFAALLSKLFSEGRISDVEKAVSDERYRDELLKEFRDYNEEDEAMEL